MKIFEFHFNPGAKQDYLSSSFCYEPATQEEKGLGSLYMVAELKNALPQNSRLISNLALLFKKEYYQGFSSQAAFKKALKKGNDFLSDRVKSGNVSWLGNLGLAVLNLRHLQLQLSKEGKIKTLLLRPGQVVDIGKSLEYEGFEPYPLKTFTHIINGRLGKDDKILILTKEVFEYISGQGLLEEISYLSEARKIKEFFKTREKEFQSISGICLLIILTEEVSLKDKISFEKTLPVLSLKEVFAPFLSLWKRTKVRALFFFKSLRSFPLPKYSLKFSLKALKLPKIAFSIKWPKLVLPGIQAKFVLPKFHFALFAGIDLSLAQTREKIVLIFFFVFTMLFGTFVLRQEGLRESERLRLKFVEVQEKVSRAQNLLLFKKESEANIIFQKAREEILPLATKESSFKSDAVVLKLVIDKYLHSLNKIEEIKQPEVFFDFANKEFVPQKVAIFQEELYFFSPVLANVMKLKNDSQLETILKEGGSNYAGAQTDELVFFSKPNKISFLRNGQWTDSFSLQIPLVDVNLGDFVFFKNNLYLLEKNSGEVIKYSDPIFQNKTSPLLWILSNEKKAIGAKSLAVNGFVFVLAKDNSVWRYSAGGLKEVFDFNGIFPSPKGFGKIIASLDSSGLFILDPGENRVLQIDIRGRLLKQFFSEKFDNLKDLAISENGQWLYLLNGAKVYRIKL